MAKLIFERAIKIDRKTGEYVSYWPEFWPIERLAARWRKMGTTAFAAGYQNDPTGMSGNVLKGEWLIPYLPADLEQARRDAGIDRGSMHLGVDPAEGGEGADPDFCAAVFIEKIGNMGFLTAMMNRRIPIEKQAQAIEDFATLYGPPSHAIIEDKTSHGYVWRDMTSIINDGAGSKHSFTIEKPTGANAVGAKQQRFLSMAPRFEAAQIRIPGTLTQNGKMIIHPAWSMFQQEWNAFPAGHDDILDAAYWSQFSAFGKGTVFALNKMGSAGTVTVESKKDASDPLCERPAHVSYGKPIVLCYRCMYEVEQRKLEQDNLRVTVEQPSIGTPTRTRESLKMLR